MVERGNFFSLMFFVVALGNLVVYAILGWFCNVTAQVCPQYTNHPFFYLYDHKTDISI